MNFTSPILAAPLLPSDSLHTDEAIFSAMQQLRYPVFGSLKKDGIRAIRLNSTLLSRALKKIPNKSIANRATLLLSGGMDMELWNKELEFCDVTSIVMSVVHEDSATIQFHLLDWCGQGNSYLERCTNIAMFMRSLDKDALEQIKFSPPHQIDNAEQLLMFFLSVEKEIGEGVCFRLPNSPYKMGRSTLKEQYLVKLARFVTAEAQIIGFEEQMYNNNRATRNALGKTERSSHNHNLIGKNTLGALFVRDLTTGHEFHVGTGFNDKQRQHIWDNRVLYSGKIISYKCKKHGEKVKPRNPVWRGFRDSKDMI